MFLRLFIFIGITVGLAGCSQTGALTQGNTTSETLLPSQAKFEGVFTPTSGISVQGKAVVYLTPNGYFVQLEGFSISEGPDLKVYLCPQPNPAVHYNAGGLRTNEIYYLPNFNPAQPQYILIHCQEFNHHFATAKLEPKN